jgi:hypothetical protein
VYPIRRSPIWTTRIQIRAIAADNRMLSLPIRSLAGCITNISLRPPVRDAIFADHRWAQCRLYVDGFSSSNSEVSDFQLMNVQSIQVLKGPQGTLFDRNTTGGAMLVMQ